MILIVADTGPINYLIQIDHIGIATMGTLGLLEAAAVRGLISLRPALDRLRATSCFVTDDLIEGALQRAAERSR